MMTMHSQHSSDRRPRIVIAGGGFGGVVAARELAKNPDLSITLITDNESFRYNPALYRVATGYWRQEAIMPISNLVDTSRVELIIASVEHIDHKKRTISASNNRTYAYDYAILALGVSTKLLIGIMASCRQ